VPGVEQIAGQDASLADQRLCLLPSRPSCWRYEGIAEVFQADDGLLQAWKWKFVWLNWCGCEGLLGRISRLGGRSLISRIFRGLARLHAQRRTQPAFVSAQVEARATDVAIGVGAAQAGAEHTVRRTAALGLDQRLARDFGGANPKGKQTRVS
jgi:hypothetical protein